GISANEAGAADAESVLAAKTRAETIVRNATMSVDAQAERRLAALFLLGLLCALGLPTFLRCSLGVCFLLGRLCLLFLLRRGGLRFLLGRLCLLFLLRWGGLRFLLGRLCLLFLLRWGGLRFLLGRLCLLFLLRGLGFFLCVRGSNGSQKKEQSARADQLNCFHVCCLHC